MADEPSKTEERRLWIGNLDTRITEFQLIKILQKFGKIEKFDMLFHKNGQQAGQPRGYAFVTYTTMKESNLALDRLNTKAIGNKHVVVRLAKNINYDDIERPKQKIEIPVLAAGATKDKKISKEIAIQAIEAKLKLLETRKDDFEINKTLSQEMPLIQKYQFNKNIDTKKSSSNSRYHLNKHRSANGPYNKNHRNNRK